MHNNACCSIKPINTSKKRKLKTEEAEKQVKKKIKQQVRMFCLILKGIIQK